MLFVASLIVFDNSYQAKYNNIINIVLWGSIGIYFLIDQEKKFYFTKFVGFYFVFVVFGAMSMYWATDFDLVYPIVTRMVVALINMILIFYLLKKLELRNAILYGILLGGLYNFAIAIDVIHVSYEIHELTGRFTGTVQNSNKLAKVMLLSMFSSLMLLVYYHQKKVVKLLLYLNIPLALYIIFLTVSKKNILLASLLLLVAIPIRKVNLKKYFIFILFFMFFGFVIYNQSSSLIEKYSLNVPFELLETRFSLMFQTLEGDNGDNSSEERLSLILNGLEKFGENPLFGVGINNFSHYFGKYAHNNYVELLVDVGLIGTILFYSMYVILFRKLKRMKTGLEKKYSITIVILLLLMDMATVSYYNKLIMIFLLFIYATAISNQKREIRNI